MEIFKTDPKINAKFSPPVPLKTYRWEDIRREKKRGKYPYTYLYKGPFFGINIMDEDDKEVKPINGEKKKKIVKKIKKVPKKKPSEEEVPKEEVTTVDTTKTDLDVKEETKVEPMEVDPEPKIEMEVEEIKTEPRIYARRNDSPTGDWWNEDTPEDVKEEETKDDTKVEEIKVVAKIAARTDSPVDWWTEDTEKDETKAIDKEENKNSSSDDLKPDPTSKSDSRTPTSDDTFTESNIDQYLDKEDISKSVSETSGAGGTTSASDAELPQDLKPSTAQIMDVGEKRKHSDLSEMTQSNLSLFEKMKNSKFKPPTFKIPKFKRFNFSKKSSKRIKTDAKEVVPIEVEPQPGNTSESPVYIRIPLNPSIEELELERQETRRRLDDGSNRVNNADTNGNISSSSSRPSSPEKADRKTPGFKKSGLKSTKKISPKSSPKRSPPLNKKGDSPEYIFIPLKGPVDESDKLAEEQLDFTLRKPTTNGTESTENDSTLTKRISPKGTLKSSPKESPKGALKKKAKLKETTTKLTKDIKKMASKLKEVQQKTKESLTKKPNPEQKKINLEELPLIATKNNDEPVEYIVIPLTGPLPENLVKKSIEDLNAEETDSKQENKSETETIDIEDSKIPDKSETKKDSLMSKLKGKPKVEKKEDSYKLEQTPKSLDILITKRSGDSPPVEYIHIPLTPTEEQLEQEFNKAKVLEDEAARPAEEELPSEHKAGKSGTEILKDTSKLVSTPLLLALESPKIKSQKSVKIKEDPKEGFMSKLKGLTTSKLESVITPPVIEETAKKFKGFTYSIKRKLEKEEPKLEFALSDKGLDNLIEQREESPPIDYYQLPVRPTAAELERLAEASKEEPWETIEGFEVIPSVEAMDVSTKADEETPKTDKEEIAIEEAEAKEKQDKIVENVKQIATILDEPKEETVIISKKESTKQVEDTSTTDDKKEEPTKLKLKIQKQKSQAPGIPTQDPKTPEILPASSNSPPPKETDSVTMETETVVTPVKEIKTILKTVVPSEETKVEEPKSLTTIVKEIIPKTTTEVVLLKEIPSTVKFDTSKSSPSTPSTPITPKPLLEEPKTPKTVKIIELTKSTSILGPVKEETMTKFKGFTSSIKRKLGKEEPKLEHKMTDKSLDSLVDKRETTPPIDYYALPVRPTPAELERLAQHSKEEPWEFSENITEVDQPKEIPSTDKVVPEPEPLLEEPKISDPKQLLEESKNAKPEPLLEEPTTSEPKQLLEESKTTKPEQLLEETKTPKAQQVLDEPKTPKPQLLKEPKTPKPKQLLEEPKIAKPLKVTEFTKSTSSLLGPVKEETITKLKGFTSSIKRKLGKDEPKLEHKMTDKSLDSLVGQRETTPPIDYYALPVRPTAAELERLAQQSKEEPWETEEGFEVITAADCEEESSPTVQADEELAKAGLEPDAMEVSLSLPTTEVQSTTIEVQTTTPLPIVTMEDVPKKKTVMEKIKSVKPDLKLSMKKKAPKISSPTTEKKVKRSPPVDKRRRDSPVEYLFIPLNPTEEELAAEKEKEIQKRLAEAPETTIPVEATTEEPLNVVTTAKKGAIKKQPGEKSKLQDTTSKLTQDIKKFAAKLRDMQKKAKKPTFKTFKHGTKVGSKKLSPPTVKKSTSEGKRSPPKSQDSMESPEYIFIPLTGPIPEKKETMKQSNEETPALIQTTTTEHSLSSKIPAEETKAPDKLVRRKSKPTTKEMSATAMDSLKKTKDFSITKLKALKDAVQPSKKPEAKPEISSETVKTVVKQGSIESPAYIVIPLKDPSEQQTEETMDTKDEELESILFEKMKIEEPVKPKKKKKVPKPPLSKEDSVRSVDEPAEAKKIEVPAEEIVEVLPKCEESSKAVEETTVPEVQKEEIANVPVPKEEKLAEPHHYEPISREDEEDGLKTVVLASKLQEDSVKAEDSPKMSKKVQFKKKKGLKTPSEDDSVIYETIQVQGEPSPSVQKSMVTKNGSVEEDDKWSKSIDHDYEPINPPPDAAPVSSPLQSKAVPQTDLNDLKTEEPLPEPPRLLRIPLDTELIQPPEDVEVQSSTRSLNIEENSTPDLQSRRSYMNTPELSSRTDGINTSQVDSSALELLPLKKEARSKQVKKDDIEDAEAAPTMQSKIKTQAGKLKTKLKSIKRPTFTIPNPKFSPKFRRPKPGPKTQGPKIQKQKFQRPKFDTSKFKMPDAPKFTMPQMPQMPQMPNMPKMPTFASMRRQSAPATEEKQTTTESSAESKPNIFDFRTYPRIFDKTKKKITKTTTMSATTDESVPEFATVPRAAARKKGPVGARWVHRFSDIQYADDEKPTPGDDLRSKDRGDSLERRMEADLRYEEALAEDEEFRDYERENQELNRRSHPGPDGEYPERWRHGNFRNPDSFDEDLPNGMDEQQRNRIGYEIQEQNRLEEMRRQHLDEHSSVASSGHHRGVLEEIDSDQFFLREKGISQDNIQVGLYLSSEIRDAFRQPVNSLSMHRDYDASDLSLTRPSRPKRKHFKKSKKAKKTPHASQEEMYDRESINTEPEEYPKNLNDFKTYPPPRPKRNKRTRSQTDAEVDDEVNLDAQNFQSQDDVSNDIETMPNILGYVEKDMDIVDEYNKYISDEALMYENEVMKDIEQPEIVISGDQKYEITKKDIDRYLRETGMVDTPKPPTRRHRSMKSLAMSDHDSIIGEFNRDKVMQDMLQQELNVYRVEHLPVEESPLAPARRSRSRTLSQIDDDRTSHGAESLRSECQESPCMEDRRDSMGYAVIDKRKAQEPPLPKRRRSTKSNRSETKFFTVPRQLNDTPPARPTRNYSTLGEPNRLKRSETDLTADEDEKENIDISQYIEIEDDDHSKNLHSGAVINKMKGRPLPAPPRPPRSRRDRSKDALRDITQETNIIGDQMDEDKISPASPGEAIEEIDMSTQTDPLPEDYCCEEIVEESTDVIVAPTRRKRSSQRDSNISLDRPKTPTDQQTPKPFRTPIDSPIPRRRLRSRDSSFSRSQDRPPVERSLSPTERRKLRSRDTSFSRSLDRPKTPSDLSRTPVERSLSPTERRRLKSRDSSFSRSLDRPKTPIEGSSSPNAMVIQHQVHTPVEDETVTHASLLVRPVAEYPADSFVSKRFAADISYDMMEETVLRKAKPDFDLTQLDLEIIEATNQGLEAREANRRDLDLQQMRRDLEISDENLDLGSREEPASEYFETDQITKELEQPEPVTSIPDVTKPNKKEKSPDYSEIIRRERTDELTDMPEKPQRRKSLATAKSETPQLKPDVVQPPEAPQPQIIERIIERQVPVVPGPDTEVEVLKAHRLQVTDLDVERLTVSELQAHKILVSEIDGVSLTINELSSKSGNLVLNGLEIPSGLIQEILDRMQSAASTSERPPSEQVATQTSIDEEHTEPEIFTDPVRTEQVCTQTSLEVLDTPEPTPMEQVATQTSLDEEDSRVPEEFKQLKEPVILIDTSTETDQDEQQEILENLKYRIRFIEEELNDLSTDITQEEIAVLKLEINEIIEIASEQVLGQIEFRDDDEPLEYIQLPGLITDAGQVEQEILIDANLLRSVPVDELEEMLVQTLSGEVRFVQAEELVEETTKPDEASVDTSSEAKLATEEQLLEVSRTLDECRFTVELVEEPYQKKVEEDSVIPKEFLQLKFEQEKIIESYQPKEEKTQQTVPLIPEPVPEAAEVPEPIEIVPESQDRTKQSIALKSAIAEPKEPEPQRESVESRRPGSPPSRPPLPQPEPHLPQSELMHGIPYPVSYYPEYVRSMPPQSFYNLRSPPQHDISDDDIPVHHRRRRHQRRQSRSSSEEDRPTISRRHTARSPEPSIPQLSGQLVRACSHSFGRFLRQLTNQISELFGGPRDGKYDMQIALVILMVLVAGLLLLGFGGSKTVHLHHWEFFNPPKEL